MTDNRATGRPMASPSSLRALRLWHWRKVGTFRKAAEGYEARGMERAARAQHTNANWHLGVVQMLNDHVSGTAEQDDK